MQGALIGNSLHLINAFPSEIIIESLALDGNFEQIIGAETLTFLEECTSKLSVYGNSVECIDVRPGSILVDVRGTRAALYDVMTEVEYNGLDLPSFEKLTATGVTE